MSPFDSLGPFHLVGDAIIRNVTLALPVEQVRKVLAPGVVLGPQDLTPKGTHPVVLSFNNIIDLRTALPSLVPGQTYPEWVFGVPYAHMADRNGGVGPGPYYFMPRLFLKSPIATFSGLAFWGFPKRLGSFKDNGERYEVEEAGEPVVSLQMSGFGDFAPPESFDHFAPHRSIMEQPLIGMLPMGMGPLYLLTQFPKDWTRARVRSLRTVLEVHSERAGGLPMGRFPSKKSDPGIAKSVLGSYEVRTPIGIGMPYPPPFGGV